MIYRTIYHEGRRKIFGETACAAAVATGRPYLEAAVAGAIRLDRSVDPLRRLYDSKPSPENQPSPSGEARGPGSARPRLVDPLSNSTTCSYDRSRVPEEAVRDPVKNASSPFRAKPPADPASRHDLDSPIRSATPDVLDDSNPSSREAVRDREGRHQALRAETTRGIPADPARPRLPSIRSATRTTCSYDSEAEFQNQPAAGPQHPRRVRRDPVVEVEARLAAE